MSMAEPLATNLLRLAWVDRGPGSDALEVSFDVRNGSLRQARTFATDYVACLLNDILGYDYREDDNDAFFDLSTGLVFSPVVSRVVVQVAAAEDARDVWVELERAEAAVGREVCGICSSRLVFETSDGGLRKAFVRAPGSAVTEVSHNAFQPYPLPKTPPLPSSAWILTTSHSICTRLCSTDSRICRIERQHLCLVLDTGHAGTVRLSPAQAHTRASADCRCFVGLWQPIPSVFPVSAFFSQLTTAYACPCQHHRAIESHPARFHLTSYSSTPHAIQMFRLSLWTFIPLSPQSSIDLNRKIHDHNVPLRGG